MRKYERLLFRLRAIWLGLTMKPIAGADDGGDGGEDKGGEGKPAGEGGKEGGDPAGSGGEGDDDELDLDRAKAKISKANSEAANLRKRLKELEPLAKKAKELEEASKSDLDKQTERANTAEKGAKDAQQEAARLRVALKKGLTETQAKRLVGETEEELEADAEELLESFKPEGNGDAPRRPRERLRPGAAPSSEPEENDPQKLAAQVPRPFN